MEVMGLMLGEFVDDYTVRVVDVRDVQCRFRSRRTLMESYQGLRHAPEWYGRIGRSGGPRFPDKNDGYVETDRTVCCPAPLYSIISNHTLLRPETVVGWYHSHPGFGCWLSSVDINTQQSFEQLTPRAVAVVIDPIQSVKGKVVIDAFRLINPQAYVLGHEARQTTSNLGHLNKPSIQALIHGLNRHYYSILINYRKTHLEENMLMNLHKTVWTDSLTMKDFKVSAQENQERLQKMVGLAEQYEKRVKEEGELTKDQLKTRYVGKVDPKKHLEELGKIGIEENIVSALVEMVDKEASIASDISSKLRLEEMDAE